MYIVHAYYFLLSLIHMSLHVHVHVHVPLTFPMCMYMYIVHVHLCLFIYIVLSPFHRYLASIGTIPKLCDLLSIQDPKILLVTLEGLDNILKIGQETGNQFATQVEESSGLLHVVL